MTSKCRFSNFSISISSYPFKEPIIEIKPQRSVLSRHSKIFLKRSCPHNSPYSHTNATVVGHWNNHFLGRKAVHKRRPKYLAHFMTPQMTLKSTFLDASRQTRPNDAWHDPRRVYFRNTWKAKRLKFILLRYFTVHRRSRDIIQEDAICR